MQKHERLAWNAIVEVAARFGVATKHIIRGKHDHKAVLTHGSARHVIGIPSTPTCRDWAVVVARKQATKACRAMTKGH